VKLLDENIPSDQRDLLQAWGVACRRIGHEAGPMSLGDDNILVLLHRMKRPTLFTRDQHFFEKRLAHPRYGLVWLDLAPEECAVFIRRFLRHSRFRTDASRMGLVARVHHDGVHFWQRHRPHLQFVPWAPS
jgi:hypothetical protein